MRRINPNNRFAVIVAYYLARFNHEGLKQLEFKYFKEAFRATAKQLGVKENYVKLRRDEFDFIFEWRRGWQRPMHKQITRTIDAFEDMEEPDITEIVKGILYNKKYRISDEALQISNIIKEAGKKNANRKRGPIYILRGPTGKKAEEYFMKYFDEGKFPVKGKLDDDRDLGEGYDFKIRRKTKCIFVEVKGMIDSKSGVGLTNKQWLMAEKEGNNYYLFIVKSVKRSPKPQIIKNPFSKINAEKNISTVLHINWSITSKQLGSIGRFDF